MKLDEHGEKWRVEFTGGVALLQAATILTALERTFPSQPRVKLVLERLRRYLDAH